MNSETLMHLAMAELAAENERRAAASTTTDAPASTSADAPASPDGADTPANTNQQPGDDFAAMLAAEDAAATESEHAKHGACKDAADWLAEPDEPDTPLIHGLIECGEMVAIVGQSKAGKSFVSLQMAVCIALGLPFLERETVRQRVYVANLEVSRKQYKKRLRKICNALNVTADDLRGWLFIDNMKGESATWDWCRAEAKRHGCTVVLIDPFYQIFKGDESDVQACQAAIDEMKVYQKDGFTLIVVFHSPKGFSGDRQLIDMISGSSMLARFPESIFGLLNHAREKQCRVAKCVLRNYPPPEDQTIKFDEGLFRVCGDVAPDVETGQSRFRAAAQKSNTEIAAIVLDVLKTNGMQRRKGTLIAMVQDECQRRWGETKRPGDKKVGAAVDSMIDHGVLVEGGRAHERGGAKAIGTPDQMEPFTQGGEE